MTRASRFFRRWAFGLALLQFVLQGAFAVADGYEALTSARSAVRPHIESTSAHCPKIHQDDCQICHVLSHGTGPLPRAVMPLIPEGTVLADLPTHATYVLTGTTHVAALPRAPPIA